MKIMKYIVPALLGGMLTLQSCEIHKLKVSNENKFQ